MTDYLERAIALADATLGRAYPKPDVGAVLVRDGAVVGEGSTEADGRHGEIVALDAAGKRARGSTLYVTMEPCAHHGTTPPCTEAIVAAGVAKVVVGSRDPNPEAAGGVERLRDGRRRGRARRLVRGPRAERGLAHVGHAGQAVRDLEGRRDARRASRRAGNALGLRRREPAARARAAGALRRSRGGDGNRPSRQSGARRPRRRGCRASRGGSPSAAARFRPAPSSSCAAGRSPTSCTRSPRTASSRFCSKAGRPSPARSWPRISSTSCSSSSLRRLPVAGRVCSATSPRRSASRG